MKKIAALCIAALGAALLVLGTSPSASAYPDLSCNLTVDRQVVEQGQTFTATGTAILTDDSSPDSSIKWTYKWNGQTKHRTGAITTASFTAPEVTSTRKIRLTGRVDTPLGTCVHHIDITVLGPAVAGPGGGGLPGTGGPAFWLLVAGLVLLIGGGSAVTISRRRH